MRSGFLGGLFTKSAPVGEAIARATGSSTAAGYGAFGLGPVGNWDIDKAVKDGMERVTWVFRAVDAIAQAQASLPIKRRKGGDEETGEYIEDTRLTNLLNHKANSYEQAWQFRYRLSCIALLSRRGAFIEIVPGRDGRPSELHLLPPGVTSPIPDPKNFVSGYRVQRSDWQVDEVPADRVIWVRVKPHPTDPYAQMTPLTAAGIAAETDYYAKLFNRNFLANDGRPGMIVAVQGQMSQPDADELKGRFGGGGAQAGRVSVIEAAGISITDLTGNPRDVQWTELLATGKEEIMMAFGVPESIMGNASGRTFDNADAERENYYIDTVVPHCKAIARSLDPLTGSTDDDDHLVYDFTGVDVLQRAAQNRRAEALAEVTAGLRTIDEYLIEAGREAWDVPGTRVFFRPTGMIIGKNDEDQKAVAALMPAQGGALPADPQEEARRGATIGAASGMRQLGNILASRAAMIQARAGGTPLQIESRKNLPDGDDKEGDHRGENVGHIEAVVVEEKSHPYTALRYSLEGKIEGILSAWDSRQEDVVTDRLMHVKSRKGTRHWDQETEVKSTDFKALDPGYALDIEKWTGELVAVVTKTLVTAIKREARNAAKDLEALSILRRVEVQESGDVLERLWGTGNVDTELTRALQEAVDMVTTAARNQSRRVQDRISKMDEEGASIRDIEKEIRKSVGARAPWRKSLSVNVVTTAVEGVRNKVYSSGKGYMVAAWNASMDERTRPSHFKADGQERKPGKKFRVGAAHLRFPGDPMGPPHEVINCRCWIEYMPDYDLLD